MKEFFYSISTIICVLSLSIMAWYTIDFGRSARIPQGIILTKEPYKTDTILVRDSNSYPHVEYLACDCEYKSSRYISYQTPYAQRSHWYKYTNDNCRFIAPCNRYTVGDTVHNYFYDDYDILKTFSYK